MCVILNIRSNQGIQVTEKTGMFHFILHILFIASGINPLSFSDHILLEYRDYR